MKTKILILLAVLCSAVYAVEPAKPATPTPAPAAVAPAAPVDPTIALHAEIADLKKQVETLQQIIQQLQAQRNQLAATVLDSQIKTEAKK